MREYYQLTAEEAKLQVNGSLEPLTAQQAAANREKYGPNELADGKKKSMLRIFLEQFRDFLVIILIIAFL